MAKGRFVMEMSRSIDFALFFFSLFAGFGIGAAGLCGFGCEGADAAAVLGLQR